MNDLCWDHRYFANLKLPVMAGIKDDDDARYTWVLKKLRLGLEKVGKRS